jgi:hypothetical protein
MLERVCSGVAGISAAGVISFVVAALTQHDADRLWIGAGVCFVLALGATLGYALTKEDARKKPSVNAQADNQSTAIAVGAT